MTVFDEFAQFTLTRRTWLEPITVLFDSQRTNEYAMETVSLISVINLFIKELICNSVRNLFIVC